MSHIQAKHVMTEQFIKKATLSKINGSQCVFAKF
jgi:hypothetical protein